MHTLVDTSPALSLFRYWSDQAPAHEQWSFGQHQFLGAIAPIRHWWLRVVGLRFYSSTSSPTTLRRADSSAC